MKLNDIISLAMSGYKPGEVKELTEAGYTPAQLKDLAKAGYKPADAKELLALADTETDGAEESAEIQQKDAVQPEPEKAEKEPAADTSGTEDKYNEMQQQIESLKSQLTAAQKQNTQQDVSGGQKDPQEALNEITRKFM